MMDNENNDSDFGTDRQIDYGCSVMGSRKN